MGKGLTVIRNLQRKHYPDCRIGEIVQTSLREIARKQNVKIIKNELPNTEASIIEEPGAEKLHAGICVGDVW
jgi:hypothetical protein